ncbi:MAG: hypothetical protein K6C30_00760 [Bacteroidaceae bacterium]|nr:hypothetical protein [Bacteroidaceae bacterium]
MGHLLRDAPREDFGFYDAHFSFVEAAPGKRERRNPHVFRGRFINGTHRKDGSLHPVFRPKYVGVDISLEAHVEGVAEELRLALNSLVKKKAGAERPHKEESWR